MTKTAIENEGSLYLSFDVSEITETLGCCPNRVRDGVGMNAMQ